MASFRIKKVFAIEILDSRGNPTIECAVELEDGSTGRAAVPSGASTGAREAVERRDGDAERYQGKGVLQAVHSVNTEIANTLVGNSFDSQERIDQHLIDLDGTKDKERLGANAILSVSLAYAQAVATAQKGSLYESMATSQSISLPMPFFNILNGGAHANNSIDIQEFMIVPKFAGNFREALRIGTEVYQCLKKNLDRNGHVTAVGDEGGFAPNLGSNREALDEIIKAIESAGYEPGVNVALALDVASSELYHNGMYVLQSENRHLDSTGLVDYLEELVNCYPIVSIEDAMAEDDWNGWETITRRLRDKVQLVGDDVFVTNPEILQRGIHSGVANAILIKLNQIGTVSETLQTVRIAQDANYGVMISHRSGETEDTSIADLAVATAAGQIKSGAPCRSERTAKYNRLVRIENELGDKAVFLNLFD